MFNSIRSEYPTNWEGLVGRHVGVLAYQAVYMIAAEAHVQVDSPKLPYTDEQKYSGLMVVIIWGAMRVWQHISHCWIEYTDCRMESCILSEEEAVSMIVHIREILNIMREFTRELKEKQDRATTGPKSLAELDRGMN